MQMMSQTGATNSQSTGRRKESDCQYCCPIVHLWEADIDINPISTSFLMAHLTIDNNMGIATALLRRQDCPFGIRIY